jgi:hypothetical protein
MFEFTTWHTSFADFFIKLRRYTAIGKQLLFANNRNRVRGAVLGLSQDGACTDLLENLSMNSLKGVLSNDNKFNPPLFSLVNTFKSELIKSGSDEVFKLDPHPYWIQSGQWIRIRIQEGKK